MRVLIGAFACVLLILSSQILAQDFDSPVVIRIRFNEEDQPQHETVDEQESPMVDAASELLNAGLEMVMGVAHAAAQATDEAMEGSGLQQFLSAAADSLHQSMIEKVPEEVHTAEPEQEESEDVETIPATPLSEIVSSIVSQLEEQSVEQQLQSQLQQFLQQQRQEHEEDEEQQQQHEYEESVEELHGPGGYRLTVRTRDSNPFGSSHQSIMQEMAPSAMSPFPFEEDPMSLVRNFFSLSPALHLFDSDSDSDDDEFGADNGMFSSASPVVMRLRIVSNNDEEDAMPTPAPQRIFSSMFSQVRRMIDDVRQRAQSMAFAQELENYASKFASRRDCPIMRACSADIDELCATERSSMIPAAVPHCLQQHFNQLSRQCSEAIVSRFGSGDVLGNDNEEEAQSGEVVEDGNDGYGDYEDDDDEDDDDSEDENASDESEDEGEDEDAAEDADAEKDGAGAASSSSDNHDSRPCWQDVVTFCPKEKRNAAERGLMGVMVCLHNHASELSKTCLDFISDAPAYNCAPDWKTFCPGTQGRANVVRCLASHSRDLSANCLEALKTAGDQHRKQQQEEAEPNADKASMSFRQEDEHLSTSSSSASDSEDSSSRASGSENDSVFGIKYTTDSEGFQSKHILPIAIAGAGFVLVSSLVAVVMYRRRSSRRRREISPVIIAISEPASNPQNSTVEVQSAEVQVQA